KRTGGPAWARFIDGPEGTPDPRGVFYVDPGARSDDYVGVAYNPDTDRFLVHYTRDSNKAVWGSLVAPDGSQSAAFPIWLSLPSDGGGAFQSKVAYHPGTHTFVSSIDLYSGQTMVQELDASGQPI